jgi:hypothetical protein
MGVRHALDNTFVDPLQRLKIAYKINTITKCAIIFSLLFSQKKKILINTLGQSFTKK